MSNIQHWWRVSRKQKYRWAWLLTAAGLYFLVQSLTLQGVSEQAQSALAIFTVSVFLWVTNSLPMPVTGIVILFLLPFSGALKPEQSFAYFGSRAVFFVMGVFILASPIMRSGLSTRLALSWLSKFGKTQNMLAASILAISALLACVISAHAVAAMLLPIVLELARAAKARPGSRFGSMIFFAMGWGAVLGANATMLGGARAPLAIDILKNTTGQTIGFTEWTLLNAPIVLTMLVASYFLLTRVGREQKVSLDQAMDYLKAQASALGPMSMREKNVILVMLITIVLWVGFSDQWGLETVAFIGVMLAFALRVADWREVEADVNWGIILMYGSAIALSKTLTETGGSDFIASTIFPKNLTSHDGLFLLVAAAGVTLTEFMSNAAAVAMLTPIAIPLSENIGLDARIITLGCVLPAGLSFMFSISTPAIAMIVGSGYVRPSQAAKWGLILNILSYIIFYVVARFYWPLLGLTW